MLGSARGRRILTSQLLLGIVLLSFNVTIASGNDGLQNSRRSKPVRRARRLTARLHPRVIRQLSVNNKRSSVSRIYAGRSASDHDLPLPVAVLPVCPTPHEFGGSGAANCDPDLALQIVFPDRYLVFCAFLC